MAETGLSLVVSKEMLANLQKADNAITNLATKSEQAKNRIVAAFTEMGQKGVGAFILKLDEAQNKLQSFGKINIKGIDFGNVTKSTTSAIDSINKLIETKNKFTSPQAAAPTSNTSFDKILNNYMQKINTLKREMDIFKSWESGNLLKTQDYAHIGRVADEINRLMSAYHALYNMQKKMGKNSFQAYINDLGGNSIKDQQSKYILDRMREYYKEEERLARQQAKEQAKLEEKKRKEAERTTKEAERQARQQAKAYQQANLKKNTTYAGALSFSASAQTINRQIQAIKYLEAARNSLSKTDSQYEQKLRSLNNAISQHKRNIDHATQGSKNLQNSHRGLMNISEQLQRRLALVFSVSQITGYVNKLVAVRGEFELQQRSLQAILQNKEEADKLWGKTVDLAVRSPFRVKELVTYTKQLAAYRIETDKLHDTTKMLADVSAGLGVDMQRLILAYGQVKAANYLRGTELRQFSEAGVNILGELAKYFTELEGKAVSVGDVFERVSKRMVAFSDVEEIFKRLTSESGIFYQMQEVQSETLKGMLSNLKDSIDLMLNDIGKSNEGMMKWMVNIMKGLVDNWREIAIVLKSVIAAFGLYKLNVLLASKSMISLAASMGIVNSQAIPKQLSLLQLLKIGFNKLTLSIKSFGASLKTLSATNIWLLGLTALATALYELYHWSDELNEQMAQIKERRDQELSQINNLTRAYKKLREEEEKEKNVNNFKDKVKQLEELQKLAGLNKIVVPIELGGVTKEDIDKVFEETENMIRYAKDFGYQISVEFAKGFSSAEGWFHIFGDNLLTDLQDVDDAASKMAGSVKTNLDKVVTEIQSNYSKLTQEEKNYLEIIEKGKEANETEEAWFERKVRLLGKINALNRPNTLKILGKAEEALSDTVTARYEAMNEINKVLARISSQYNIKDFGKLSMEQKVMLRTEVDKVFEKQQISEQTKRWASAFFAEKLKLPVEVEYAPDDKDLADWQMRYNAFIKNLNNANLKSVKDASQTREALRGSIEDMIKAEQSIIKAASAEGSQAYSEEELRDAELAVKDLTQAYVWLGGTLDDIKKKGKKDSEQKILNNRISLIKELNKKYEELNKTFDETTSKEKVLESYKETFKEAFKDTGINLEGLVIDNEKVKELVDAGQEAGEIFSEQMLAKMDEVMQSGTYIRSASDVFKEILKSDEGLKFELYDDKTGEVIKNAEDWANKVGTATIGFGHAVFDIKEATKYFGKVLNQAEVDEIFARDVQKHQDSLNLVLDSYNELILTQEQYDALLNKAYQGGSGAVKRAIQYAIDVDKGIEHIDTLTAKMKAQGLLFDTYFGHDFVDKFKQAETVAERLALILETMNLTTKASGGNIDLKLFNGMLKRSKEVAAQFAGDVKLTKLLEKSSISISQIDFSNLEGVAQTLKRLMPLAQKEGEEAVLALQRAIDSVEVEIGLDVKEKDEKAFFDQIEKMFSGYELSIELQKLNIPKDWAKDFFGIDTFDLSEIRKELEEKLAKGDFGKESAEELKNKLNKVEELEAKSQQERLKTYLQYARDAVGERAKIKLEEMKKLQEIEKTFTKPEQEEVKQKAIAKVKADSQKDLNKLEWEEFQKSDTFIDLFDDLDNATSSLLNHSIDKLREFKEQWKDMPLEDMRSIVSKISELEEKMIDIVPIKALATFKDEINDIIKSTTFASKEGSIFASEGKYISAFEEERKFWEDRKNAQNDEIYRLEAILNAKEEGNDASLALLGLSEDEQEIASMTTEEIREMVEEMREMLSISQSNIDKSTRLLKLYGLQDKAWAKMLGHIGEVMSAASDLSNAFSSLNEALGKDSDGMVGAFADAGINAMQIVVNTISLVKQIQSATKAALTFGTAMKLAMGVIGWIVMAVELIANSINKIVAAKDNKLDNQIKTLTRNVEDLDRALAKLEDRIDSAFSLTGVSLGTKDAIKNLQSQIYSYERMIKLEKDKKKTDTDSVRQYEEAIDDLKARQRELEKEAVSSATSGILDSTRDAARQFVDAWYDAFAETGDGLQGLKDNFKEIMLDMIQQQASMTIAGNFLNRWKAQLDKYINADDLELTTKEASNWMRSVQEELPMLNEALQNYFTAMEQAGLDLSKTGEMSGLQRGIQSVTEETAQALEALLNSTRFFVADSNAKLTLLVDSFTNPESANPMLSELRSQTDLIRTIRDMFSSVIGRGDSTHSGAYLKVVM